MIVRLQTKLELRFEQIGDCRNLAVISHDATFVESIGHAAQIRRNEIEIGALDSHQCPIREKRWHRDGIRLSIGYTNIPVTDSAPDARTMRSVSTAAASVVDSNVRAH